MNFLVWLLIAFLAGLFIWLLMGQQKASVMAMSRTAGQAYPQGTQLVQADQNVQVPSAALSDGPTGRPICEVPLDPCVGDVNSGIMQGDRQLIVGSYLSPLYFNTGAWSPANSSASC